MKILINFDIAVFYFVNQLPHNVVFDTIAMTVHRLTWSGLIYYPLLVVFLFSKDKRRRILAKLGAMSGVATFVITVQWWIKRSESTIASFQTVS